jgi:hypothetical protein
LFITLSFKEEEKTPLTWKADVLLMMGNPHPLWSLANQLPSPYFPISPHPFGPYYVTMTTSTISVFLIWNNTVEKKGKCYLHRSLWNAYKKLILLDGRVIRFPLAIGQILSGGAASLGNIL